MPIDPLLHPTQSDITENLGPPHHKKSKPSSGWRSAVSVVLIFIVAGLLAWFLTVFVFQQYQVDGMSMQPTLQNDNRLIVLKVARSWSRITGHAYIPNRGDIVIFTENNLYNLNASGSNQLVKRVIGLPGDRVVVQNDNVTVYNKQHPKGFHPDATLPYGKVIGTTSGSIDITVPPDQIFVFGDNRSNSLDSRVFGAVPAKEIVGKLVLRITPLNEIKKF